MTPRKITVPTPPQFPEIAKIQSRLSPVKLQMREESVIVRDRLRNNIDDVPDYNHAIYVGARELAILDSLRFLRNLPKKAQSSQELLDEFQRKIDVEVSEALTRKALKNDYEQMLGKGSAEGFAIVQEILDSVQPKHLVLEAAQQVQLALEPAESNNG